MHLTELAVKRPVTTLMGCLMVLLLGAVALRQLAVDLMPDISYPSISVITLYDGAGPEEVETLVTRPLEQALSAVHGVDQLSSSSMEGSSTIRVRMVWGSDLDTAMSDMRAAIEKIRRELPDAIEPPYLRRYDVADSPIMYLGLSSKLHPIALTRLAEQTIVPRLERVAGVAAVRLRGAVRREIQVEIDREKLESLNMGVNEVVAALHRENVNQPAGDFDQGHLKLLIRSHSEFHSLDEIANTAIRRYAGAVVRVRDVAEVVDGVEERTELSRVNGTPGLMVYIYRQAGANTVHVSDRTREAVAELNSQLNKAELKIRVDKAEFIRQSIANIQTSALFGMGLAVVVLILFLHSFRSTLVIGVSMPLAVLATFVLIYFQGFTLNIVSFGGLALGIGMLVDNSIVVIESVFRKREDGLDPQEAAIAGTREVSTAIIASTVTTLIVFLPLLFVSGMTGVLLHQLAWVVSFSLVCSLLVSLTLTPMLAAWWIADDSRGKAGGLRAAVHGFHGLNRGLFGWCERLYGRLLRFSLAHSAPVGLLLLALFAATLGLTPHIGTEFLPKTDEGTLRVEGVMPPGIQLETLDRQARALEADIIAAVPEALTTAAFIGGRPDEADEWNECSYRVYLPPRSQRERGIEEIRRDLADRIRPIPGMRLTVRPSTNTRLFRMIYRGGASSDLNVEVRGHDVEAAEALARAVERALSQTTGLVNVEIQKNDRRPELAAWVDRQKASLLGVSVSDIAQTLETTIRGTQATVYRDGGDEYYVRVRLRESDRDRLPDVQQVSVATPSGKVLPLKNVVDFSHGAAPVTIDRLDQQRVIHVSADVERSDLGSVVAELRARLDSLPVPDDFSLGISGDWEQQQESFQALQTGFVLAVLLMYMVMAAQFESLRDPLLILITIPLGAIGVILVLVCTDTTLNVQSFIGLVILAGIVVNNAIVLVDYVNRLRLAEPEADVADLIVRAATRRFRPILMTTLTTVLAMLPIALGFGEGGELQAPMARVVVGGLLSATLITLLAIPLVYQTVTRRA